MLSLSLTNMSVFEEAQQVLKHAQLIYSAEQVSQSISQMADKLNQQLQNINDAVLIMPVMNGGLVLSGRLIPQLTFPLQIDYLHATRYRNTTQGCQLQWKVEPQHDLNGRTLVIVDDIYDEGYTLQAVVDYCQQQGAARIITVVLVEKNHPRDKAPLNCDIVGLQVEDRYVFGCGMDYKSYHRNLDGIYALNEEHDDR